MPSPQPELRRLWKQAPGAFRGYILLSVAALGLGLAILLGGRARASAPAWRFVYTMGGPEVFGTILAVLGAILLIAPLISLRLVSVVMLCAAAAMFTLAFAFGGAALADPRASFTGGVIYLFLGLHLLSHRVAYREGVAGRER